MECWELKKWVLNGVECENHCTWSKRRAKNTHFNTLFPTLNLLLDEIHVDHIILKICQT